MASKVSQSCGLQVPGSCVCRATAADVVTDQSAAVDPQVCADPHLRVTSAFVASRHPCAPRWVCPGTAVECPLALARLAHPVAVGWLVAHQCASTEPRSADVCPVLAAGALRDRRCEPTWAGGCPCCFGSGVPLVRTLRWELGSCWRPWVPLGLQPRHAHSAVCGLAVILRGCRGHQLVATGCVFAIHRAGRQGMPPWASGGPSVGVLIVALSALPIMILRWRRSPEPASPTSCFVAGRCP